MTSFSRSVVASGLCALLLASSCGSDVTSEETKPVALTPVAETEAASSYAEAYCKILFSCGCEALDYASEEACRAAVAEVVDARTEGARQHNLAYDGDCVAHKIHALETRGCEGYSLTLDEQSWGCEESSCNAYHGEVADEAYCGYDDGYFTDCTQGSYCNQGEGGDGRCHTTCIPSNPVADGQVCYSDAVSAACQDGSYCESTSSGICKPKPGPGQLCGEWTYCAEGAYCDGSDATSKCQVKLADGAACDNGRQCLSRGCNAGVCGEEQAYICIVGP